MARKVSSQVAYRNAAAVKAEGALTARGAAHAVVTDLEARVAVADAAWKAAMDDDDRDLEGWMADMMAGSPPDDLYITFKALNTELIAARAAHAATVITHDAANARLARAEDVILRDRAARFRRIGGKGDDFGFE